METTIVIVDGQEITIPTAMVPKFKTAFGAVEK